MPLVVGVIRTPAGLEQLPGASAACDLVELRIDLLGPDSPWREAAVRFRAAGLPVLITARWKREGGSWAGDEASREAFYRSALADADAVDIEIRCGWADRLVAAAREAGVRTIGSFHDFEGTPDDTMLATLVGEGVRLGVDLVKLAFHLRDRRDLDRLLLLPSRFPGIDLGVVGMGPLGPESRLALPLVGSFLTYGFADSPSAPGQTASGELCGRLAEVHGAYRAHRVEQSVRRA